MRVSVCVGNYAKTPYSIAGLGVAVYSIEELCYCLRENAFLLDLSLLDEKLVDWIGRECGIKELATELYPLVRKQGSLSAFVVLILECVGLYSQNIIQDLEKVLKEGAGLSGIEKRKNQIDYLVRKKKYVTARNQYNELLAAWQEDASQDTKLPGNRVKAGILHNKGVALVGMMEYEAAAKCFLEAYETDANEESYLAYFAAMRADLSENEYLSFLTEHPDSYELSLKLEREIERAEKGFQEQTACKELEDLKEWRFNSNKQRYYDEVDKIARALKENYRSSVSE